MEIMHIEARYTEKFLIPESEIVKLPAKICIATTVQFLDSVEGIKEQLEKAGKKVSLFKGKLTKYHAQVLGCEILTGNTDSDSYLYIGDGRFHPIALKLKSKKEVFMYNPFSKKLEKLDDSEIKKIENKYQGALSKYYSASKIGVLISTKKGQNQMKRAVEFKKKTKDKEIFLFLCDTLDFQSLENFNFIEVWVNTMCPRIAYDDSIKINKAIVNIDDIFK